jgi:hypothetical protein
MEKMEQLLFPGFTPQKTKMPFEILESKINLHFHEIKVLREEIIRLGKELKDQNEILCEVYMRKTP